MANSSGRQNSGIAAKFYAMSVIAFNEFMDEIKEKLHDEIIKSRLSPEFYKYGVNGNNSCWDEVASFSVDDFGNKR